MDAVLGRTCLYGSLKMDMIVRMGRVDRSQERLLGGAGPYGV